MKDIYRLSPGSRHYHRESIEPFNYTDGSEEEQRMFDIVAGVNDVGTFSDELLERITDWPSEYHLTRARHCLLRPLDIQPGDRVLELGCGCGAISRYLGEIGAEVVAVEGSAARASIAAERCRDLPNVRVVVDDLQKFESDETFDWVTLIGVLEYSPKYSESEDPVQSYLASAAKYLKPNGRLVVAIENRLGLKYFNACAEDHLGVPYVGVQDLYEKNGPQTFGKKELSTHLAGAGFSHYQFLYPWPDYKLPSVVLSDSALKDDTLIVSDMLARSHARDYSGNELRAFDDALAIDTLARNGLLGDLSNSFLVIASREQFADAERIVAVSYGVRRRFARFCTETRIARDDNGRLMVRKLWLTDEQGKFRHLPAQFNGSGETARSTLIADGASLEQRAIVEPYTPAKSLLWPLLRANARGQGTAQRVTALLPWFDHLMAVAEPLNPENTGLLANWQVEGHYLDCNPSNLLASGDRLVDIDQEWVVDRKIALGWVLCRGVLVTLSRGLGLVALRSSIAEVVTAICMQRGLTVTDRQLLIWLEQESDLQEAITGTRPVLDQTLRPGTRTTPIYGGLQVLLKTFEIGLKRERVQNPIALISREMGRFSSLRNALAKSEKSIIDSRQKRKLADARADHYKKHLTQANDRVKHYQERVRRLDILIDKSRKKLALRDAQIQKVKRVPLVGLGLWVRRQLRRITG